MMMYQPSFVHSSVMQRRPLGIVPFRDARKRGSAERFNMTRPAHFRRKMKRGLVI